MKKRSDSASAFACLMAFVCALAESARRHAEATLPHVASGNYEGEHWLASFAVYMLSTPEPD